ncbi:hypothetical protein [Streptomyces sp. NPDC051569]|uniref:hypothetical protein n=1 Tax=Streptomyces sp. NPDC051569 TaxID=3365661 RepID=UPI0037A0AE9D
MADSEFYMRDRPANPRLPEDRPRGSVPGSAAPEHHRVWTGSYVILAIIVVVAVGIALFP